MSIDQRGNRHRVRLRRNGRAVSASFDNRADAEAFAARWTLAAIENTPAPEPPARAKAAAAPEPVPAPPAVVTVEAAAREFVGGIHSGAIRTRGGHVYKASTVRGHENRLRLYVVPLIGAVPVAALTRGDVIRLVEGIAADKTAATARNVRDVLRLVLARQLYMEAVGTNVAAEIATPSPERRPARFLTPAEADRLQTSADAHEHPVIGAMVATALDTGLRLGELQAVPWGPDGLDLDARRVRVAITRDRTGALVTTKSRRERTVPLGPELVARLRRYRMAAPRSADGAPAFWRSHRRAWEQVREGAGIPDLHVHDLRHTAATFWLAAGLTVHAVADLLGHTDAALVLRLYGHALPAEVATAGERMEAWRADQRGG